MKIKYILIILIILLPSIFFLNYQNKNTINKPVDITLKDIKKNNVLLSNVKITSKNDKYYFTAKVTNLSSNKLKMAPIKINLKQNNEKIKLIGYIGEKLEAKASQNILIETKQSLKEVSDIDISVQN